VTVARSIALFALAALAEIGGAWLVWQGWREHHGLWWIAAGVRALGLYRFVATFQPDPHFGRSWPPTAACSSPAPWPGAWSWTGSGLTGGT
jgi:drug/metabolite transporter superfamily protein YnfA